MKRFLLFISLAVTIVSCENLKVEYSNNHSTMIVSRETKDGTRYGVGYDNPNKQVKASTPVIFSKYSIETQDGMAFYLYAPDGKTFYFFDRYGRDILSGNTCNQKELTGLIPIVNDGKQHKLSDAERYYGKIFGIGRDYFTFTTQSGDVYAVVYNTSYAALGPYKNFFPGFSGYMYQDVQTGKWGARALVDLHSDAKDRNEDIDTPVLVRPEYDEIIEVQSKNANTLFARKGQQWEAYELAEKLVVYKRGQVVVSSKTVIKANKISVNRNLLNRALKMQLQKEAKWTTNPDALAVVPILAHGQRIGTKEASVAFL